MVKANTKWEMSRYVINAGEISILMQSGMF